MPVKLTKAFTYIELLVVGGITATIMGLGLASVTRLQTRTTADVYIKQVMADVRSQQLAAMNRITGTGTTPAGVYFDNDRYVLFYGSSYNPSSTTNFSVAMDSPWVISSNVDGSTLVFSVGSGEVSGLSSGQRSISVSRPDTGDSAVVYLNKYGVFQN